MDYYTLRIWILIFLSIFIFLICRFCFPKRIRRSKTFYEILIIIIIPLFLVSWIIPYEKYMQFDRVEKAFHYYFPNGRIIKKLEQENYTYLFYTKDEQENLMYFIKDHGTWKFDDAKKRGKSVSFEMDGYTVFLDIMKDNQATSFILTYPEYLTKSITLTDSMQHQFTSKTYKKDGVVYTLYALMTEEILPDDYTIYINEKAYKLKDFY